MMEIAFGPVIAECALNSLVFGALFALVFPMIEARMAPAMTAGGFARRVGLALLGGGLFGLTHLAIVCAADGFPPRIIQSAAVVLALATISGAALVRNARPEATT